MLYSIVLARSNFTAIRIFLGKLSKYCRIMVILLCYRAWLGFSLISMYMIDVNFIGDSNKYSSGILQ